MKKENIILPEKSACICCPFRDDKGWLDMKKSQQTKFTKEKRIEYQILRETGGFK